MLFKNSCKILSARTVINTDRWISDKIECKVLVEKEGNAIDEHVRKGRVKDITVRKAYAAHPRGRNSVKLDCHWTV